MSPLLRLQQLAGNRAVTSLVQRLAEHDETEPERVTGYLGLNPLAGREVGKLERASRTRVMVSLNDPAAEAKFREPGDEAVFEFVEDELGITLDDFARWDRATDILLDADPAIREQLADVMRWFNQAENGEITLERLVLSGHSNGVELWGESDRDAESKAGTMVINRDLQGIVAVFPNAAAQVQDIMFSACFSINAVLIVTDLFPNLQTCWSYKGFSPDIKGGSGRHIAAWAEATEGDRQLRRRDKQGNSALWTREDGFVVGDPAAAAVGPLYTRAVQQYQDIALPMLEGDRDVPKATLDPLYQLLQEVAAHPGADDTMRTRTGGAIDRVLRLRFWSTHVRGTFGHVYQAELGPAYEALGLDQPDWDKLTRVQLKAHLEAIDEAIAEHPDQATAAATLRRLVRDGLWNFDTTIIRSDWI